MRKLLGIPLAIILVLVLFVTASLFIWTNTAQRTIMSTSFVKAELEEVGAYSLAKVWLDENVEEILPGLGETEIYSFFREGLSEEWLAGQVGGVLDTIQDFLDGVTDTLEITISTEGFKEDLKTTLQETLLDSPPAGLEGLSPEEMDSYLGPAYTSIDELPGEILVVVEGTEHLVPIRDAPKLVSGVSSILMMLAALAAVLLLLVLMYLMGSRARSAFCVLGGVLAFTGACALILKTVVGNVASSQASSLDLPSPLTEDLVLQIVRDSLAPAGTLSIVLLVVGLGMIAVSVVVLGRRFF